MWAAQAYYMAVSPIATQFLGTDAKLTSQLNVESIRKLR